MDVPHGLNIAVHVGAGVAGIGLGLTQLSRRKGDARHGRTGLWLVATAPIVTGAPPSA